MKNQKKLLEQTFINAGIVILSLLVFLCHRHTPFMMDDNWYATNLATGESLHDFSDIIESQIWHFFNWGGRNITHGILQITLMLGEPIADILNLVMTLLLAWLICVISGQKKPFWFLTAFTMLIGLNANVKMSMFWQAGAANYVYATVWIYIFVCVYIHKLENPDDKDPFLIHLWMIPLGLMTGWSNENMGPASFLLAVAVMIYLKKYLHKEIPIWMITGAVFSLLGSCLVILAPGNFVRTAALPKMGLAETIGNRILSMLQAGTDYLFPSVLLMTVLLFIYFICLKKKFTVAQWFLLVYAILSYGAMVLSPHYPDRATFGTMSVCIILIISMMADLIHTHSHSKIYCQAAIASLWGYSIFILLHDIYLL